MSDSKPGFFKRLLGSLMGGEPEPAAPEPEAKAKSKAPAGKQASGKRTGGKQTTAKKAPDTAKSQKSSAGTKTSTSSKSAKSAKSSAGTKAAGGGTAAKKGSGTGKAAAGGKTASQPKSASGGGKTGANKTGGTKSAAKSTPKSAAKTGAKTSTAQKPETQKTGAKRQRTQQKSAAKKTAGSKNGDDPDPGAAADPAAPREVIAFPAAAPEAAVPVPEGEAPAEAKPGWFARMRDGLSKTSNALTENITGIFTRRRLDDETLQELEDALIQADLGVDMAMQITEAVARGRYNREIAPAEVRAVLGAEVAAVLEPVARPLTLDGTKKPHVILVVGVNGTGKTTTIGKLAHKFAQEGRRTVMAAGDTFRAAAIDQLGIWGERTGSAVVARETGADAAGLAYDALEQARETGADALMIDTAGRLQNKKELMDELAKIVRVVRKLDESAPHSVLLVLDATTGQNAMRQVEVFQEIAGVTGLIMTKLDGTARGGILVAIAKKFGLPVHAIGVGESVDDLQPFDAHEFASLIAGAREKVDA